MSITATATQTAKFKTPDLRRAVMRKRSMGSRIKLVLPMSLAPALEPSIPPHVPFHIELATLRRMLNPYNVGNVSSTFLPVLRVKLAKLEERASVITAHRKAKIGTAIVGSMAVKPVLTADEVRRAEIAAELYAAGGFVGPRPRKSVEPQVVKRPRRPRGSAKAKVSWLDVVETKNITA